MAERPHLPELRDRLRQRATLTPATRVNSVSGLIVACYAAIAATATANHVAVDGVGSLTSWIPAPHAWAIAITAAGLAGHIIAFRYEWRFPISGQTYAPYELALVPVAFLVDPRLAFVAVAVAHMFGHRFVGLPGGLWHRQVTGALAWGAAAAVASTSADALSTAPAPWLLAPAAVTATLCYLPQLLICIAVWAESGSANVCPLQLELTGVTFAWALVFAPVYQTDPRAALGVTVAVLALMQSIQRVTTWTYRMRHAEHEQRRLAYLLVRLDDLGRNDLADAIHGGPLQGITAANLMLSSEPTGEDIEFTQSVLADAAADLRRILAGIGPVSMLIERFGVGESVRRSVAHLVPDTTQLTIRERFDPSDVTTALAVQVYRVVTEAVTNALKHASATNITVTITTVDDDQLTVAVVDDGRGTSHQPWTVNDSKTERPSLGLALMAARVEGLGGTFTFDSSESDGTRVTAAIPIAGADALLNAATGAGTDVIAPLCAYPESSSEASHPHSTHGVLPSGFTT